MKKTFSWLTTLFLGLLLIVGCANGSQPIYEKTQDDGLNKDGLSVLTLRLESISRSIIVPDDWTESKKKNLLFKIESTAQPAGATVTLAAPDSVFTWDELKKGKAIVYLDPGEWTLKMTAYQVENLDARTDDVLTKPVLESAEIVCDLTSGDDEKVFPLSAVSTTTTAVGDLDLQVNFYNELDAEVNSVEFQLIKPDGNNDIGNASNKLTGVKTTSVDFATIGKEGLSAVQLNGTAVAGRYQLVVLFKNKAGNEIGYYENPIIIDGGNRTGEEITIKKGTFGKIPEVPSDLDCLIEFKPADPINLYLGKNKTLVAQELDANVSPESAPAVHGAYNASFTWTDNSETEKEFELVLTIDGSTVKINKAEGKIDTADGVKITDLNGVGVKYVSGNLYPGSAGLEVSIPTGKELTKATICAKNNISLKSGVYPTADFVPDTPVGMFTVTYGLTSYSVDPSFKANIYYTTDGKSEVSTTKDYFVVAYNMGTKEDALIGEGPAYPLIDYINSKRNFKFSSWKQKTADSTYNKPTFESSLKMNDTNIVVYPSFTSPLKLKVTYPEYGKYKTDVVANPDDILKAAVGKDKITIKPLSTNAQAASSKFSEWKYKIIEIAGDNGANKEIYNDFKKPSLTDSTISINSPDGVLTWDTTDPKYINGGYYSVYVEALYSPDGKEAGTRVGNTIYVKLIK